MNTLDKYKALKQEQKKLQTENQRIATEEATLRSKANKSKYNQLVYLIKPFDKENIEGHDISLKFHDKTNKIDFFIDGKFYVMFCIETNYHPCNCSVCSDGGYGHEGSYSYDSKLYKLDENNEQVKGPYFVWYGEDSFVSSMDRLIKEYETKKT